MFILESVIGSNMHETAGPKSDVDYRRVYVSPLADMLDPFTDQKIRTHQKNGDDDVTYELQAFLKLLSKGSPSVIDIVYSPHASPLNLLGQELIENRLLFINKDLAKKAMYGYIMHMQSNADRGVRPLKSIRSAVLTALVVDACLQSISYDPLTSPTRDAILKVQREAKDEDEAATCMQHTILYPLVQTINGRSYTNHFDKAYVKDFCYRAYTKGERMNA